MSGKYRFNPNDLLSMEETDIAIAQLKYHKIAWYEKYNMKTPHGWVRNNKVVVSMKGRWIMFRNNI